MLTDTQRPVRSRRAVTPRPAITEADAQRHLIAQVHQLWRAPDEQPLQQRYAGDAPLLQYEAAEWVHTNWPALAAALDQLVQHEETR